MRRVTQYLHREQDCPYALGLWHVVAREDFPGDVTETRQRLLSIKRCGNCAVAPLLVVALLKRFEAGLHFRGGDLLPVQRPALGKQLGAFERADDHRIETRVAD